MDLTRHHVKATDEERFAVAVKYMGGHLARHGNTSVFLPYHEDKFHENIAKFSEDIEDPRYTRWIYPLIKYGIVKLKRETMSPWQTQDWQGNPREIGEHVKVSYCVRLTPWAKRVVLPFLRI